MITNPLTSCLHSCPLPLGSSPQAFVRNSITGLNCLLSNLLYFLQLYTWFIPSPHAGDWTWGFWHVILRPTTSFQQIFSILLQLLLGPHPLFKLLFWGLICHSISSIPSFTFTFLNAYRAYFHHVNHWLLLFSPGILVQFDLSPSMTFQVCCSSQVLCVGLPLVSTPHESRLPLGCSLLPSV